MNTYSLPIQVRWSDLDPNVHLRHSVYYDWAAYCRIEFLSQHGLQPSVMQQLQVGPILFREECVFKKEIRLGDKVSIDLELVSARADYSRWTIRHTILKNDNTVSAIVTVEGAWLDLKLRKLAVPGEEIIRAFSVMPVIVGSL